MRYKQEDYIIHLGYIDTKLRSLRPVCETKTIYYLCRTHCGVCHHVGTYIYSEVSCRKCLNIMAKKVGLGRGTYRGIICDKLQEDGYGEENSRWISK